MLMLNRPPIENGLQPARIEPLSKRTLKMDIVRHWRAHHWMLEKKLEAQGVVDAKTAGKQENKDVYEVVHKANKNRDSAASVHARNV